MLLLAQTDYVRSHVVEDNVNTSCLTWRAESKLVLRQNVSGIPTISGEAGFAAIRNSINTWNAQLSGCSSLSLQEGPRTTSRRIGLDENAAANENVIVFRTKLCRAVTPAGDPCLADLTCNNKYDCWDGPADVVAVTLTTYDRDTGRIADADIEYNAGVNRSGGQFFFTAVNSPTCPAGSPASTCVSTDVENTTTHELGHFLGLAHTSTPTSVMFKSAPVGETTKRTLDVSSKQFACDVYPKGKASRDCVVKPASQELYPAAGCSHLQGGTVAVLAALCFWLKKRMR